MLSEFDCGFVQLLRVLLSSKVSWLKLVCLLCVLRVCAVCLVPVFAQEERQRIYRRDAKNAEKKGNRIFKNECLASSVVVLHY